MPSVPKTFSKSKKRGFALVLALALMSLVFLLVISLVSLVGTDLSLAELRKQRVLSQANARMGMMVALGELQKHLGPDTRISGTADLLDERIEKTAQFTNTRYDPNGIPTEGIDLNENGQIDKLPFGQRYWTGVWKHRASNDGSTPGVSPTPKNLETGNVGNRETMYDTDYDPHPEVEVAWLVSGNEGYQKKLGIFSSGGIFQTMKNMFGVPDGIFVADRSQPYGSKDNAWEDYENVVKTDNLIGESKPLRERSYAHPLIGLPDPENAIDPDSNETVWILKRPLLLDTYDENNPQDWKNHLAGEPVKVRKTAFPLSEKEDKSGVYAYWVGDEGVKTKVNLTRSDESSILAEEPNMDLSPADDEPGFDLPFDGSVRDKSAIIDTRSYASLDAQAIASEVERSERADKVAANYHSLTTDSLGVLADVRAGGLKRDLSSAFALSDSEFDNYGFGGWIFQERVHYMKNFEPNLNNSRNGPKANEWLDREGTDFIFDEGVLAAGPKWSVLRSYYNSYKSVSSGTLSLGNSLNGVSASVDKFPRSIGDNTVIFDSRPNGKIRNQKQSDISKQYNYFSEMKFRPEPSVHSFAPVLLEVKYAQEPYFKSGKLGLAVYPSIALWNPYDVTLSMENDLVVEIPLDVDIQAYNTKDWDVFRQWYIHHDHGSATGSTSATSLPTSAFDFEFNLDEAKLLANRQPWIDPPPWGGGSGPFLDLNGNGRRDPGEPWNHVPQIPVLRPPGGGGGGGSHHPTHRWAYNRHRFFSQNFRHPRHPDNRQTFYDFRTTFPFAHASSIADGRVPHHRVFRPPNKNSQGVPLRLRIQRLRLEPGEKAHYVLTSMPAPAPWNAPVKELVLGKGNEGALNYAGYVTDYQSDPDEPITLRYRIEKIKGVNRGEVENYDGDGNLMPSRTGSSTTRGITMYEVRNTQYPGGGFEWPIRRINKQFAIQIGSSSRDYARAGFLNIDRRQANVAANRMHGNGFRIRWQLPGNSDKMVFQQYNPRCLMDSYQAGSGDNWVLEKFNGCLYQDNSGWVNGSARFFTVPDDDEPFEEGVHFIPRSPSLRNSQSTPIMPRIDAINQAAVGFFHDNIDYDGVNVSNLIPSARNSTRSILFGVPRDPVLSLMQFRHANLNYYLQGSAYQVGNSYASTQVGRYKTWGRVRRIDFQPHADMNPEGQDGRFTFVVPTPFGDVTVRLFPWDVNNWNYELGTVRSTNSEFNHQNVVLDQNYYLNQALFDGYFLSGDEQTSSPTVESSNPRYLSYHPKVKTDAIDSSVSENPKFQTNAGKLLIDGAFNVNSTSVEAWISQLASLKKSGDSQTPFPRTFTLQQAPNRDDPLSGHPSLTDEQIELLAEKLVEEVKLRGPFLSFSDFINRRLSRMTFPSGNISLAWLPKQQWPRETRDTVAGLRGPVQAAIAKAKFNSGGFSSADLALPTTPARRWNGTRAQFNYVYGNFGIHAVSLQNFSRPKRANPNVFNPIPNNKGHWVTYPQAWGSGVELVDRTVPDPNNKIRASQGHVDQGFANSRGQLIASPPYMVPVGAQKGRSGDGAWEAAQVRIRMESYTNAFEHGEAPDAILAVENVATGANLPGWLTQADVLAPLAPVLTARSDTFTIRVMGESPASEENQIASRSWIEVTVQRVPEYVKASLDAPHHRPHEPFEDRNFDGIWNDRDEYWLDLNQNSRESISGRLQDVSNGIEAGPDLPGVGDTQAFNLYAVGLPTDRKLNEDKQEEVLSNPDKDVSRKGINQRFGRKFKIIKFRWLRENEV